MYDIETGDKFVTVDKLKSILQCIPGDHSLFTTSVGNVGILDKDKNYVGYVDFNSESIEVYKN